MSEEGKSRGVAFSGEQQPSAPPQPPPSYYYGTFQGVANYQQQYPPPPPPRTQPQPAIGFPQPVAPPGINTQYYFQGYQTVPGYAVAHGRPYGRPHGRPVLEHALPCCGCGIGWFLFIIGFFFGAVPWYIGAFILLCVRVDYREKPGLVACMIASILALIAVTLGVTKVTHSW